MKRPLGLCLLITAVSAAAGVSANEEVVATNPEEIVANVCAACHGQDGNAMITGAPKLGGQRADYLTKVLGDYKSGARNNPIMAAFAAGLSKEDMKALGLYFSKQASDLYTPKLR